MTIRNATEADWGEIIRIYNAAIPGRTATADLEPVSLANRYHWFQEHTPTHHPIWVMEIDQEVAGWLSFQSFVGRAAYQATAEISIYVAPGYQRRGVGRQLLTQAINQSPALNLKTLIGLIFAHNQPSLQLFEGLGFQRWGYMPQVAELEGIERDLVIVGRRI